MKIIRLGIICASLLALASCSNNANIDTNSSDTTVESTEAKGTNEETKEETNDEGHLLTVEQLINENSDAIYDYAMYIANLNDWNYENIYVNIDFDDLNSKYIKEFSLRHVSFIDIGYTKFETISMKARFTSDDILNKTYPNSSVSNANNGTVITNDNNKYPNLAKSVCDKALIPQEDYLVSFIQDGSNDDICINILTKSETLFYVIEKKEGLTEAEIINGINNNTLELKLNNTTQCGKYYIKRKAN